MTIPESIKDTGDLSKTTYYSLISSISSVISRDLQKNHFALLLQILVEEALNHLNNKKNIEVYSTQFLETGGRFRSTFVFKLEVKVALF